MATQFKLPLTRIKKIPVGSIFLDSEDHKFPHLDTLDKLGVVSLPIPQLKTAPQDAPTFRVLHFATYIPLHGMDVTIHSAKILEDDQDIKFLVVGRGQLEGEIKALAKELDIKNMEFKGWVPVEELHRLIAQSHVSLGIFGTTEKTRRVIPSKAFDTLAVGRPLISGDTPAMREAFTHRENIYFVPLKDPEALAGAIREMKENPGLREKIAQAGHKLYQENFTPEAIGNQFLRVLQEHFKENFNHKDKVVK